MKGQNKLNNKKIIQCYDSFDFEFENYKEELGEKCVYCKNEPIYTIQLIDEEENILYVCKECYRELQT